MPTPGFAGTSPPSSGSTVGTEYRRSNWMALFHSKYPIPGDTAHFDRIASTWCLLTGSRCPLFNPALPLTGQMTSHFAHVPPRGPVTAPQDSASAPVDWAGNVARVHTAGEPPETNGRRHNLRGPRQDDAVGEHDAQTLPLFRRGCASVRFAR